MLLPWRCVHVPPFLLLPTHRLPTLKSSEDTCLPAERHEARRPADNLHLAAAVDVDAARLRSPGTRLGAAGAGVRAAAQPARGRVQLEERLLPLVQSRFHHPGHRPAGNVSPHVLLTKEDAGAMKWLSWRSLQLQVIFNSVLQEKLQQPVTYECVPFVCLYNQPVNPQSVRQGRQIFQLEANNIEIC